MMNSNAPKMNNFTKSEEQQQEMAIANQLEESYSPQSESNEMNLMNHAHKMKAKEPTAEPTLFEALDINSFHYFLAFLDLKSILSMRQTRKSWRNLPIFDLRYWASTHMKLEFFLSELQRSGEHIKNLDMWISAEDSSIPIFDSISKYCTNLSSLDVGSRISAKAWEILKLPRLKTLVLYTDCCLETVARNCPEIDWITVFCEVSSSTLSQLPLLLHKLQGLFIHSVSDESGLICILQNCKNLRWIGVYNPYNISMRTMQAIRDSNPGRPIKLATFFPHFKRSHMQNNTLHVSILCSRLSKKFIRADDNFFDFQQTYFDETAKSNSE